MNMKLLWFILVLHATLASAGFGRAYMRKSKLCHEWICINNKLNLPDGLPPKEDFSLILHNLLPPGPWQEIVENVVETCYNNRTRKYSNTCPGQGLLHCAVDQLHNNCPLEFSKPHDACAPINSLAGFKNMFTQSRYKNMDTYLPLETRPMWFLKNYFKTTCCDIPLLFNETVLSECGFNAMLAYYTHAPVLDHGQFHTKPVVPYLAYLDPLDCCDISNFIEPTWRHECDFKLKFGGPNRLIVEESMVTTDRPTTTSERPIVHRDVMLLPQSCEKETCVFNKLGILSDTNTVSVNLFAKLLDNFSSINPGWNRAKARAITTCLNRPLDYDGDCEINKVLTCLFDVLTENCPNAIKDDPCKHTNDGRVCQISSSKYRPKHRRGTCNLPELVNKTILNECGLTSLSTIEQVNIFNATKEYKITKKRCKDLTPQTSCVLTKMGVLNKYGFVDYFKMKDRLKNILVQDEYDDLVNIYGPAFANAPLYTEHCNSPRKLLNIIDTMISTCPQSKRNRTNQCSKLYEDISLPPILKPQPTSPHYHPRPIYKKYASKIVKQPLYNFGFLNSKYAPKVETIDLTQKVHKKPLVLLPVYMRVPNASLVQRPYDSSLRSGFFLPNSGQTEAQSISPISTTISTISTASPISPTPVSYLRVPNSNLLIRSNNKNLFLRPFLKNSSVNISTISATSESISTTPTNESVSTTSTNESVSTTSTNKPVSTTSSQ